MELENRNALITGASRGLGKAIARAFLVAGANVSLCARDNATLEETVRELSALAKNGQRIVAQVCDVANEHEVAQFVDATLVQFGRLEILVNNAGVYGPMGTLDSIDWDHWRQAIEINLYGAALLMRRVLPYFRAQGYGKIINLSGGGATSPLPQISAYAASKAALVRLTETVAEEMRDQHIDVNAVAPGALDTRLLDEILDAGPEVVGAAFYEKMVAIKKRGGTPLEKGAALCVFLASSASDGITGKLISAEWDPWRTLMEHKEDLKGDVYTLRRIVPKDRGMNWGDV